MSNKKVDDMKKSMTIQTIGHDKINQLRHVRFFGDMQGVYNHMHKHADILRPKFEAVLEALERDLGGKVVVPGLVDMHVHLREPGYEASETVLTGSRAAAAGGFTCVTTMPNTTPAGDSAAWIREQIEKHMHFDEIYFKQASPAIAVNSGPGTFGLLYMEK